MLPDWPNSSTPTGTTGARRQQPSQARVVAASCTVTIGSRRSAGSRRRQVERAAPAAPGRARSGDAATRGTAGRGWSGPRRRDALGVERPPPSTSGTTAPHAASDLAGRLSRLDEAVAAGHTSARSASTPAASIARGERTLVQRAGRQPQVRRAAAGRAGRRRPSHSSQSRLWAKAGSASVRPGSSMPIDAVIVDWCAPPSGARVTPAGVPTTTNAARVEAVDQGVEAAADERVVDRPDRQQVLAMELVAEAQGVEQQEQVHLADAQLDVPAGR